MLKKKIAVILLNWNGIDLLKKFIPTLLRYSTEANVYVIDNCSDDESVSWLQQFPEIQIIQNKENFGFAKGYNIGLQKVQEPYWCLINSDVEVTQNWLIPIIQQFENEPNIAVIQPKIKDYNKQQFFEYAGAAGGFIDQYGFPFCRGRIFNTIEKDLGQYDTSENIFWASGACFFVRKSIFNELKGFDERFYAHMEEIDLCWRIQNYGYHVKYNPKSCVYHIGGATLKASNPKKTYLNYRNSLMMLYKNLPSKGKFKRIFIRLCLDGISGVRLMLQGKPLHCFAIVHSHFGFYKRITSLSKEKNQIDNYFYTPNIVWNYFILKKKTFDQL